MNRTFWWIVAILVVIIAIWASVRNDGTNDPQELGSPTPSAGASISPNPGTSPTATPTGSTGGTTGGTAATSTYTALVAQYEGRRIQFDQLCQANPANPVFKAGTKVMFDNRSGDARTITIGGTKYYFQGYGYRIIKLGGPVLPAKVSLNCGAAVNVGTITVER